MASEGSFTSTGITYNGATRRLIFNWEIESTITGQTTIKWWLTGTGGNKYNSTFTVKLNGTVVCSKNNEVVNYKGEIIASGTKAYSHDSNGNATINLEIQISKIGTSIANIINNTQSWSLDENMPYTACYWDTNAYVTINDSIQAPGKSITIRWSGAQPGTANPIAGFEVYYSLNGGDSWNTVDTSISKTATSTTLTVPSNRGSIISAKVVIKNTENFTNPSKIGGSCKINNLPSAPTNPTTSSNIVPSNVSKVQFTMTMGKDDDGQNYSIKYATSPSGTKYDYTIGNDLSLGAEGSETTFYFWTWDGLELSSSYASYAIKRNSKPTVSISVSGTYVYDITVKHSSGQSNNTYSYGYTYDKDSLITTSSSDSCNVGDIRYHLSKQLEGLAQGTTYKFKYWVQRNDGVEDSERVYSTEISFTTPTLTLDPGDGPNGYFGTYIDVQTSNNNNYYPTGMRSFASIKRGELLGSIDFKNNENSSQSFNIKIPSLTRVYAFDFAGLQNSINLKPYSQPTLPISMAARDIGYGFNENNSPALKLDDKEVEGIFSEEGSDNTWNFKFTPDHLWGDTGIISNVANDNQTTKKAKLTIQNAFGESFSKEITLNLDFKETPEIKNFKVCRKDEDNDPPTAIKEKSLISIEGVITYYGKTLRIVVDEPNSGLIFYNSEITKDDYKKDPWTKNNLGGWVPNPHSFDLSNLSNNDILLPAQEKTYNTNFQISAHSTNTTGLGESQEVTIQRHIPARVRFTKLEYSDNGLSGSFKIEDFGYDAGTNGYVSAVYLDEVEIYSENITTNKEISFTIKNYNFGEANFKSLAPVCKTIFNLNGAETIKETSDLEYLVVYNVLPTVAYRQNYLGINTKNPSKNGKDNLVNPAVTISAYNNQNKIYLISSLNTASINLETGEQIGFIIDCGKW